MIPPVTRAAHIQALLKKYPSQIKMQRLIVNFSILFGKPISDNDRLQIIYYVHIQKLCAHAHIQLLKHSSPVTGVICIAAFNYSEPYLCF